MNDVRLVEGLANQNIKAARKRVRDARRLGQAVSLDDLAAARGLVVAERDNSIFSDAWLPLAVVFLIGGYFLGRNIPCMTLGAILISITAVGAWWRNQSLGGVDYGRYFDRTHVFPGEPITMTLEIENNKRLPLTWLQFQDAIAGPLRITSEYAPPMDVLDKFTLVSTFAVRGFEHIRRTAVLQFAGRGFYRIGPLAHRSGDPFTLFTTEREFDYTDTLVVYPQVWPLEELGLPAKEPFGDLRVRRSLFTDPIKTMGIRDYQPQDRFRDVHWKATARRGSLQTKVYDPSTGMTAVVFLNVATFEKHWMGSNEVLLERLISVAASMVNYGAEQKWGIGIYANGSVPRSDQPIRVRPGRSPNQLLYCLEALAAVTGYATGSIEKLLQQESPRLPWVSTLIVVTGIVTPELAVTLTNLKEAGRRVVLISLSDEPTPKTVGDVLTYHIPTTVAAFQPQRRLGRNLTEASLVAVAQKDPVALEAEG